MEVAFARDLRLLTNALRHPTFRFIVIGHNRKSIITDVTAHIKATYPDRPYHELRLSGNTYREFIDGLKSFQEGIVVIPDFDWLFQPGNESICTGFNQRRDALAKLPIAMLCFVEPSGYRNLPKRLPDWWSLRSLELEFERETTGETTQLLSPERGISSLGGQKKEEKEAEIGRLLEQLAGVESENKKLLLMLLDQIATLYYERSDYDNAKRYWEESLALAHEIGNKQGEGATLNNISQIYHARGDYETALTYLQQSLIISQQIGDKEGEGKTLNNISQIYDARGDHKTALTYLQQSLTIQQQIGDKEGEGATLNNISLIYDARGDYEMALTYLQQSLSICQQIGNKEGEGATLNNIGQIYDARGDYKTALTYLQQSLSISQQIGDKSGEATSLHNVGATYLEQYQNIENALPLLWRAYLIFKQIGSPDANDTAKYLDAISQQIGIERYNQLIQSLPQTPEL